MTCPYISGNKKTITRCGYDVTITEIPVFIDCLETTCPFYNEYDEVCKRANAEIGDTI